MGSVSRYGRPRRRPRGSVGGACLTAISLVIWRVPLGFRLLDHHAHWIIAAVGALAAVGAAASPAIDRCMALGSTLRLIIVAFASLYLLAFEATSRA